MSSYKPIYHAFDYNCIQTSSLIQAIVSPFFWGVTIFGRTPLQEQNGDEKSGTSHVHPWQRWNQMRAPLLHTCGRESRVSQSVWRQLENSPEPGLIESLSSSLCASWAVGDRQGAIQRATLWWDLEDIVGNRRCRSFTRIVKRSSDCLGGGWCEICQQGIVCAFFSCACVEMLWVYRVNWIQCVSRLRVCVLRLCCSANPAPTEGLMHTAIQKERKEGIEWEERVKEKRKSIDTGEYKQGE